MKVGFVLECSIKGPDASIYPYLAKKFCPTIEIAKPETMGNKQILEQEGPLVAKTLLEDGCDFVFIVWDRMPKWGGSGSCEAHKEAINAGLDGLDVDKGKIFLCCIKDMLESWMLGDGQTITAYFQQYSPTHVLGSFPDYKSEIDQSKPEEKLSRYNGRYNKFTDNFEIVKRITDFNKIAKRNNSFAFFKESVEKICAS